MGGSILFIFSVLSLITHVFGVATWPSSIDELEDIKYLNDGYNSRGFAFAVTPCSFTRSPGRSIAGGFVRTAFHDMAPADVAAGTGGVDGSIGFELQGVYASSNGGPAFNNTITYYSRFFNSQASISDLIALGVYTAVRGCGGPIVNTRAGRIDATGPGALGVPDIRDPGPTLQGRFIRMGLTQPESISIVACGHTLGGVHATEFPSIVPPNSTRLGVADFDSTNSTYDNKIVTEYLDGTTKNVLVVGPDPSARSDLHLFNSDQNATIKTLADPAAYRSTCAKVLQKMIDTVPSQVKLTDAIEAYPVKPSGLQLNVLAGGDKLSFTGQIRIRTNDLPKSTIFKVEIEYKDRDGNNAGTISSKALGDASGFDDTFTFYGFDSEISAKTALSSFTVVITLTSGSVKTFDNNGKGFPVSDKIFSQTINSSLSASSGTGVQKLNIVAAARNGQSPSDLKLTLTTINAMSYNNLPTVSKNTFPLVKGCESKYYTFYSASADAFTNQVNGTKYDVSFSSGGSTFSDEFNAINILPSTAKAVSCDGGSSSGSTSSSIATTSGIKNTSTSTSSTTEPTTWTTTTVTSYTTFCPGPTTFTHGTKTFTVTEATTLTITDCPCEITVPWKPTAATATSSAAIVAVSNSVAKPATSTVESPVVHNPAPAPVSSSPVAAVVTAGSSTTAVVANPAGSTTKPAAVATFTGGAATPGKRADLLVVGAVGMVAYLL